MSCISAKIWKNIEDICFCHICVKKKTLILWNGFFRMKSLDEELCELNTENNMNCDMDICSISPDIASNTQVFYDFLIFYFGKEKTHQ